MARDSDGIFTEKWADGGDTGEPVGFDRDEGWPISYSQPGGNHPTRLLFNLLFKELSALAIELNQNGAGLEYNATIDYVAKAIVRGSDGDFYVAESANGPAISVKNPVGDTTGVWKNFYLNTSSNVATGTANAIVLNATSGVNPSALFDGQLSTFKAAADNTGAVTIKNGALAPKWLRRSDGTNFQPGEIQQNEYYTISYNKTLDRFEPVSGSDLDIIGGTGITATETGANEFTISLTSSVVSNIIGGTGITAIETDVDEFTISLTDGRDIPSGKKILFYENTAVLGYSLLNTLDDKVVYVTKGSAAGGQTGGAVHSTGTWTQPNHSHTGPSHNHQWNNFIANGTVSQTYNSSGVAKNYTQTTNSVNGHMQSFGDYDLNFDAYTDKDGTGATGSSSTANTWRPAAYSCTLQQRI